MIKYSTVKKIIGVFQLYGIRLMGTRKFDNLYKDLGMDKVYVGGLIYELELVSGKVLNESEIHTIQQPAEIIQKLLI